MQSPPLPKQNQILYICNLKQKKKNNVIFYILYGTVQWGKNKYKYMNKKSTVCTNYQLKLDIRFQVVVLKTNKQIKKC